MTLTPSLAAQMAKGVYGVKDRSKVEQGIMAEEKDLLTSAYFDFGKAKTVTGDSGAGIRVDSGFSIVVPYNGSLQGEYIVATRGTLTAPDWFSNFTAAMEPGPAGTPVHAGFNRVAKSVAAAIDAALPRKNPSKIHVVGHSLGGAVSNLLAASFAARGIGVELYTFGAPRPGLASFRDHLAEKVGEENIYRAFNLSDPVPLVPIHPFLHAPGRSAGALVGTKHGIVNPFAHKMGAYRRAIGRNESWQNLINAAHVTPMNIEELLTLAAWKINIPSVSGGLYLLGRILKKLLSYSNVALGTGVTGAVTVLDQIGMTLTKAQTTSPEIKDQVDRFAKYTLIYAGLPFKIGAMITSAYLTHVLGILLRTAVGQATMAITRADQDA